MKSKYYIVIILVIAFTGILIFSYWYGKSRGTATWESTTAGFPENDLSLITTAHPSLRAFTLKIPWTGTAETQTSVELITLVSGRVAVIDAEDQSQIEKGQRIMRLGGPLIEDARARLGAEIKSLKTQVNLAHQTSERFKESLSRQLATKNQAAAAQEAETKLDAQLGEAQLSLRTLENQIDITSPINGTFTNRKVNTGQDINAGQVVGEIIDTGKLRITASLYPPRGIEVQGREATIRLSENQNLKGVVQRVLPQDLNTGAISVWLESPQIDTQLRPGQMVSGDIVVRVIPDSLAVPESAIVYDSQEHPHLFISKDGSYESVDIQLGLEQDGWVEVLSGLKKEQLVVTRGAYELFYKKFNEQFRVQD